MAEQPPQRAPQMYAPAWFRSESGLLLPSTLGQPQPAIKQIPRELLPKAQPIALAKTTPTFMDQVAVYADEAAAGLQPSSLEQVRDWARQVPFETGILMAATIAAKAFGLRGDQAGQLAFAQALFGEAPVVEHLAAWMKREGKHAHLFAEQHALMLERILIENAKPGVITTPMTGDEPVMLTRALLGCTSVAYIAGEDISREARVPEDLLAVFLQNSAYNSNAAPMGEMARAHELFVRIAHTPELLPSQDKVCPLDEWMMDDYSFTVEEQLRIGFALAAITEAWQQGESSGKVVYLSPENIDDLLLKFGVTDRRDEFFALISADRSALQAEFAAGGQSRAHVAWETRPFMRHPFLRCENGGLILLSPRAITSWLSDGFHYRLLDSAQRRSVGDPDRKLSRRYTAYAGQLLEVYALNLMRSVHLPDAPVGGGRVYGEQPYGKKLEKKTSDGAVDLGLDLVLIEVSASRVRADTLLLARRDDAMKDIDRMIIAKIDQLDKCITGLRSRRRKDRARIPADGPEVDMTRVERIWPVILTAGNVTQSDPLWRYIESKARGKLTQARVQPLTILDIEDYEALCAIVEAGYSLSDVLAGKTQPTFRYLELAMWLIHDPHAPKTVTTRPAVVRRVWDSVVEELWATTDFTKGIQSASDGDVRGPGTS